jgi:hypothetical protein
MKRRLLAVGSVALVSVVMAACGGDGGGVSKGEYETQVAAAGDELEQAFNALATTAPDASSLDALAGQVEDAQNGLRQVTDDLVAIEAPEDIAEAHTKLTGGLAAFADDLDTLVEAAAAGDLVAIESFGATFLELDSAIAIQEAIDEIQDKGYDVSGE